MTSLQFFLGVFMAITTFLLNHKIKKVIDIKILVNTLFELYGHKDSFNEYNAKDVNTQLMQEILAIEKMYDANYYIKKQVNKLITLRLLYFNYDGNINHVEEQLKLIKFKRLGKTFIILTLLNLNPEFIINNK